MPIAILGERMNWSRRTILAALAAALVFTAPTAMRAQSSAENWVSVWGFPSSGTYRPSGPPPAANAPPRAVYENVTVRQIVRVLGGGSRVRVRLSNEFGQAPLKIGAARIGIVGADGAIRAETERALTFGGAGDV